MAIGTVEFDLSMVDQETGRRLTARAYTVEGITNADGTLRELSIGQLVMALCLDRASKLEAGIIALMEEMNDTSSKLEALTEIEQMVVDWSAEHPTSGQDKRSLKDYRFTTGPYNGVTYYDFLTDSRYGMSINFSTDPTYVWINSELVEIPAIYRGVKFDEFVTNIEAKMDEMNSFSQQKMIELQSQTSKRDQAYDMISNILKSLNTVLVGNANNM
jgi:hypothetical protein